MEFIRTPEERFENLLDYPYEPNYVEVDDGEGGHLRMHYVDEGAGEIILCLHGQPSWSYLYRKMIPIFTEAGYRVIAPDLVGFGKSDKPTRREDYTYASHVYWLKGFIEALDLNDMTLVCQDWGSLLGLRLVAENDARFARVVLANGGLPDGSLPDGGRVPEALSPRLHELLADTPALPIAEMFAKLSGPMEDRPQFMYWVRHCDAYPDFHPAEVMKTSLKHCSEQEYRAWAAPFPSDEYMQGARQFPSLVPIIPDNAAIPANRAAWSFYEKFDRPFLTVFGDSDPVTRGGEQRFIDNVPGARGQKHCILEGAGHFIQDDAGERLAAEVLAFLKDNPAL